MKKTIMPLLLNLLAFAAKARALNCIYSVNIAVINSDYLKVHSWLNTCSVKDFQYCNVINFGISSKKFGMLKNIN